MSTFDSTKLKLSDLLDDIVEGKIQLPDFQRGWVWDDEHIRSLLVSIARSFPIGAVMILETGGETRFQLRPVEGVTLSPGSDAERLILDGQQRLTSLTQVVKGDGPVATRDDNKRPIKRHYYFDIAKALEGPQSLEAAIIAVDERKTLRSDFGRQIDLDLSSPEKEYEAMCFPCSQILDSDAWEEGLNERFPERFSTYMTFRKEVLAAFRGYMIPVILLKKETSKEAVCLVFEKVNTGGVALSVFELVTASYAADGYNMRKDWFGEPAGTGRKAKLAAKSILTDLEPTDFLQGIALLDSRERRLADLAAGKKPKEATTVSAKREHVLSTPLPAYQRWTEPLTGGFLEAEQFLRMLGFHHQRFLPYRSQLVPLATVLTHLKERWLEPAIQDRLARWFWCGVLGEMYGGAVETRIALDYQNLMDWLTGDVVEEPVTVVASGFQESRLDTLRTRNSAAYRGLYVLVQQQGACDFFWKTRMLDLDLNERGIDIHHIFPRKWCDDRGISPRIYNSIINKTAISAKANRMIGGNAPSHYLEQIQTHKGVQLDDDAMDSILRTHCIEPRFLRADDFDGFYRARKAALLDLVENSTGKGAIVSELGVAEDEVEEA
tara:strand:- start:11249 stop:13069 length:1821 start_codon:yes stop_codon:yes gene_type:complete